MILSAALLLAAAPSAEPLQRQAKPLRRISELFSDADYPVDALIRHAQGRTRFELFTDDKGVPYSCRILESAKEPSLDRVTCDLLMARARFTPALDLKGVAIPGSFVGSVVWRLPEDSAEILPFSATRRVMRVYPTAAGVSHCELTVDGRPWPRLTREQCLPLASREAIDFAESLKLTVPVTIVDTFDPDGDKDEGPDPAYGTVLTEMTIALRIDEAGKVIFCQTVGFRPLPDMPSRAMNEPDLCKDLDVQTWKYEPSPGKAARSGRFRSRVYVGEDPADAKPSRRDR
ncbi:MAG TPA: energy transducer TonB [Allosphingosinicella sp.]|jgi:hypothetical protein|nr:energy transducer TonB [Allosphingosinicella sp.]